MLLIEMRRGLLLVARAAALGAALLWLAFFVEHSTWFLGSSESPPARVWWAQLAHGVLIAGLLAAVKWPLAGNAIALLAAATFFVLADAPLVPVLFAVTIAPSVLFLAARVLRPHATV